ncbi:MAG: DEAD/DEAH box helicase [Burkholderiaceae bacterium]
MHFSELGLDPAILKAVTEAGYESPTPIQAQAIPHIMAGLDVMGAAQTGTGKTAAFTLPILHRLMAHANTSASPARHPVRGLVLAPTRELADQIYQNVQQYATYTALRSAVVFGGMDMNPQTQALRAGVELLVATPGRLLDHVQQKTLNLSQVSILVLDEADRMLDMGFLPDLQRIVNLLPASRQSLLFSATFSPEIRKLAKTFLNDKPVTVEVARRNATAENLTQKLYRVDSPELKRQAVIHLVREEKLEQVIVFTNTKIGASRLARELIREGIAADAIHGDKSQNERLATLERFKNNEVIVLVATDVAARGLDIAELPAVINFDMPHSPEDYVHRIGRTGRAGASGLALSLMVATEERQVAGVEALIGKSLGREGLAVVAPAHAVSSRSFNDRGPRSSSSYSGAQSSRAPAPAKPPAMPADPIFYAPYDDSSSSKAAASGPPSDAPNAPSDVPQAGGAASVAATRSSALLGVRRPANPKSVLLGGKPSDKPADS